MYVDGYLLPIPKKNVAQYRKLAAQASKVWLDHGALEYRECVGDDLDISFVMPFPKLMKLKPGETAILAWIVYKSKADRNRINKKVMADPRMNEMMPDPKKAPFDMKRMCFGGFKLLVEALAKG